MSITTLSLISLVVKGGFLLKYRRMRRPGRGLTCCRHAAAQEGEPVPDAIVSNAGWTCDRRRPKGGGGNLCLSCVLRRLGRTGLLVSELGFGAANVATAPEGEEALLRAFTLGINFVETGPMYRLSEYMILGRPQPPPRPGGVGARRQQDDGPLAGRRPARPGAGASSIWVYRK